MLEKIFTYHIAKWWNTMDPAIATLRLAVLSVY
jgi:hypothetical protein